ARGIYTFDLIQLETNTADNNQVTGLDVYPTITNGDIYIENNDNKTLQLLIVDTQGRVRIKKKIRNSTIINLDTMDNGVYICTLFVEGSKAVVNYKIVKI
ncbi:MAG: T9SS type A sorting domain-containing protein, partial [Saprospiraceae bacterium]